MAIDGVLMHRIVQKMDADTPLKINRITQISNHEFLFQCFAGKKKNLYVSTHPVFSRIQWTQHKPSTNLDQTHFLNMLRKHLEGGIIQSIRQFGTDRVVEITIEHRDNMGVIRPYRLMVELLGKYANIIVVNEDGNVVDALKRITPFENNSRAIVSGSVYEYPPQFDKKSFQKLAEWNPDQNLRDQFAGISPLLEKEILHRLKTESATDIIHALETSDTLYVYDTQFHILELSHRNDSFKSYPIMEGLDIYYRDLQEQDRIKAHTGDLLKVIRRELKRSKLKLPKLYDDYDKASDSEHLREAGDLLFAFGQDIRSGQESVTLPNFEGSETVIVLDPRFNGKDNARRYFKRYQKAKKSLKYLDEQILATEARIEYFEGLLTQAEQANVADAQEIQEELRHLGILFQKQLKPTKLKNGKKKKPNVMMIQYDETTEIFIGKNNIQNEYITFKLARKEDTWFHVAHDFGAHVLIKTPELDEAKIRLCAHLAAYFSKSRLGSSVEVNYTQARNLKKIPGAALGRAAMSQHKSIFIDPDEAIINHYLER